MFCPHCGHPLPSDAFFCPNCGNRIGEMPDASGTASESAARTGPSTPPKIDCGLSLAILAVIVGSVIGIVALIYSVLASDMLRSGNYEGARRAARTGKIWSWTAIILSAIGFAAGLLLLPHLVDLIAPGLLTEP